MTEEGDARTMTEEVAGHRWEVAIRTHRLAEWKRSKGLPTTAVSIRCDGVLIAFIYPVQVGGIGIHIVSDVLDFENAFGFSLEDHPPGYVLMSRTEAGNDSGDGEHGG